MATHRYWRVWIISCPTSQAAIARLEFRGTIGGVNLATTAASWTASSQDVVSGWTFYPHNVIDGATAQDIWQSKSGFILAGQWIAYDFGSGTEQQVVEVYMQAPTSATAFTCPSKFQLQYSDNGTTWTESGTYSSQTFSAATWTASSAQTFSDYEFSAASTAQVSQVSVRAAITGMPAKIVQVSLRAALPNGQAKVSQVSLRTSVPYVDQGGPWVAVAAAGGPSLVQVANKTLISGTGTLTTPLTSPATAGDLLIAVLSGAQQTLAPPAGWSTLLGGSSGSPFETINCFYTTAVGGETSVSLTASAIMNLAVFELSSAGMITGSHGQATSTGANIIGPSMSAAAANVLRILAVEENGTGQYVFSSGDGSVYNIIYGITGASHHSAIFEVAPQLSSTLTIPWSASPTSPVYGLIEVAPLLTSSNETALFPYTIQ